jgi:hypothetical protein
LRPEEFQRNRERVVDEHFLAGRDVEITFDQVVDEVPREINVAARRRERGNAPALVRVVIFARRAYREGRHLVEEEVETVVVIEHNGNVRFDFIEPLAHRQEAVEKRFPVCVLLKTFCDCAADSGYVRRGEHANDSCHEISP